MTKDTSSDQRGGLDGFYDALRRPGIARSSRGNWFGGVAAGLARWLGVDPLVIRAAFILLGMFFGMGLTLYLVLCLLMPDERGNLFIERALKHGEGWAIFLLVITAMSVLGDGPWGGSSSGLRIGGYVVAGALAWWFLTRTDTGRTIITSKPWARPTPEAAGPDSAHSLAGEGAQRSTGNAAAAAGATLNSPAPFVPRPMYHRTPSIGFAGGLLALGLAIVAGVVVSLVAQGGTWSGNYESMTIAIAAGLGVLGVTLVLAGLAGRRAGWIGGFAWLGIWAAIFTSIIPSNLTRPWQLGDQNYVVTSLAGSSDYQLGIGQMSVNLTVADWKGTDVEPDRVTATLGVGELDLVLPPGAKVTVNARGRAGELIATGSNQGGSRGTFDRNGTGWSETLTFGPTTGTPDIVIDAEVGLGQINITTGSPS